MKIYSRRKSSKLSLFIHLCIQWEACTSPANLLSFVHAVKYICKYICVHSLLTFTISRYLRRNVCEWRRNYIDYKFLRTNFYGKMIFQSNFSISACTFNLSDWGKLSFPGPIFIQNFTNGSVRSTCKTFLRSLSIGKYGSGAKRSVWER